MSAHVISEDSVRKLAKRRDYRVEKSRKDLSLDNFGHYMLVEASNNTVVLGSRYDATLEQISHFLRA